MQDILLQIWDKIIWVQENYQNNANKRRKHEVFQEGDMVLLYGTPHRYKTVKFMFPKLWPRFYGILRKNFDVSYKLILPPSCGMIYPTFHISWLKKYVQGNAEIPEVSSYVPKIEDEHIVLVPKKIPDVR